MSEPKKKRLAPIPVRATGEQIAEIERRAKAAGKSRNAFMLWRALGDDYKPPRVYHRKPVKDDQALARLLAKLGETRLASNINQLAKATNSGSLPVTPDVAAALHQSADEIAAMSRMLRAALGFPEERT
jgi:hypothetical protein